MRIARCVGQIRTIAIFDILATVTWLTWYFIF